MLATTYTVDPALFMPMRNRLHKNDPKGTLGRNLTAAFKRRGLSARSVARSLEAQGLNMSNKTVSNMLNGEGNPQLDNLLAVAAHVKVPLWQLLLPTLPTSQLGNDELHELLDGIVRLSDTGRAQVKRTIRAEHALDRETSQLPSQA